MCHVHLSNASYLSHLVSCRPCLLLSEMQPVGGLDVTGIKSKNRKTLRSGPAEFSLLFDLKSNGESP